ncbi:MAG: histidine kinase [Thermodesulfovibrionales bacterium]
MNRAVSPDNRIRIRQLEKSVAELTAALDHAEKKLDREMQERARISDELQEYRDYLDRTIAGRTQELRKVNKDLRAEIMRRIQMEKELVESQRFVNRIADTTPNLLYIYDVITNRNIYINPRITDLLGYSAEQIKQIGGQFFQSVLHPDDTRVFEIMQEQFQHAGYKDILESEYRMKNVHGEWRWFLSRDVIFKETSGGRPQLILGIAQDITERKKADEELSQSREQLRVLLAHLQSVREEERTRISREIHDELGQSLTALKIDLSWLVRRLTKDQEALAEKALDMSRLIDLNIQTVKRISAELRPGLLDDLGLTAALEWQAEEFEQRQGIRCELMIRPNDITLDRDISTAIFRIFQETLTNVVRHAKASRISVVLEKKPRGLVLTVRDDGRGITKKQIASPTSIGLIGMRERVNFLGGTVDISGTRNKGTTVKVFIPLSS